MIAAGPIVLRAWRESDIEALQRLRNDIELQQQLMTRPKPNSLADVRNWLNGKAQSADTVFFVIAATHDDSALGYIQLARLDFQQGHGYLGICLAPEQQGRGVGAAACQALFGYAQSVMNLRKILLEVLAGNQHAIGLYRKLGFRPVGQLMEHYCQNRIWHDVLLMERLLSA
jgi:diamine N-acetyltransferase